MSELDRRLFDEYKRLDAVCRDIFSCQYGVSEYISQMERAAPWIRTYIPCWDEDYRTLKRLRWLRNRIAHETSSTDCDINDIERFEDFYNRLLIQQDPLAVLEKSERNVRQFRSDEHVVAQINIPCQGSCHKQKSSNRLYVTLFGGIAVAVLIILIVLYLFN